MEIYLSWGWDSLILIKSIIYVAAGLKYVAAGLKYVAAGLKYVAAGRKYVAAGLKYVAADPTRNSIKTAIFEESNNSFVQFQYNNNKNNNNNIQLHILKMGWL